MVWVGWGVDNIGKIRSTYVDSLTRRSYCTVVLISPYTKEEDERVNKGCRKKQS